MQPQHAHDCVLQLPVDLGQEPNEDICLWLYVCVLCLAIPAEHPPAVVWQLLLNPTHECNGDVYSLLHCIPQ